MLYLEAVLLLMGAHYVADFAMQNAYVAAAKADPSKPDWIHALTGHAVHHVVAAGVALAVLGLPWLIPAFVVGVTHWVIDYGKAVKHAYGYHADQIAHLVIAFATAILTVAVGSPR